MSDPHMLMPASRPYFDKLCVDLEQLMFETSQESRTSKRSLFQPIRTIADLRVLSFPDLFALEHLITKLHRTGLLQSPRPSSPDSRRPSFFTPMFSSLLAHLAILEEGDNNCRFPPTFF